MPYKDPIKNKECVKKWREDNKEYVRKKGIEWRAKNKDNLSLKSKKYYLENRKSIKTRVYSWKIENHEYSLKWGAEYRKRNRTSRNKKEKERLENDVNYLIIKNIRSRIGTATRNNYKTGSAVRDLGCTIPEFKKYIEKKFTEGMCWSNWKRNGWHLDHIIPLSKFNLSDREQFLEACHYTNLQPMWATENIRKGNKVGWVDSKNPIYQEATLITKQN